ncbi:MAG: DUF3164 family protein, partial [Pseudomonadota bacterium]
AWSEGSNDNLKTLIFDAFQVNKEGKIDTGRVLGLRRLNIEDDKWVKAMEAVSDAVRVTGSRTYIRFYEKDESGATKPISLDIATL